MWMHEELPGAGSGSQTQRRLSIAFGTLGSAASLGGSIEPFARV